MRSKTSSLKTNIIGCAITVFFLLLKRDGPVIDQLCNKKHKYTLLSAQTLGDLDGHSWLILVDYKNKPLHKPLLSHILKYQNIALLHINCYSDAVLACKLQVSKFGQFIYLPANNKKCFTNEHNKLRAFDIYTSVLLLKIKDAISKTVLLIPLPLMYRIFMTNLIAVLSCCFLRVFRYFN